MAESRVQFTMPMRILHWVIAAMVLAMLGIGVAMVTSLGSYHVLISIHRPLGIGILILACVRLVTRLLSPLPPFPSTVPRGSASWRRHPNTSCTPCFLPCR